ncbi:MAG: hypothetical protein AABX02_02485, partial [archaeon]
VNNYQFDCPDNPGDQPEGKYKDVITEIQNGTIGLKNVKYKITKPNEISFSAEMESLLPGDVDLNMTILLVPNGKNNTFAETGVIPTCSAYGTVSGGNTLLLNCSIPLIPGETYLVVYTFGHPNPHVNAMNTTLSVDLGNYNTGDASCSYTKTTAMQNGINSLDRWIDGSDEEFGSFVNETSVKYTSAVPSVDALNALTHFTVLLKSDGYSHDFEHDFREYYTKTSFADAPTWFKKGENAGYQSFYGSDNRLAFNYQYADHATLATPGTYAVDVDVTLNGDDWQFFDSAGNPQATIDVQFYLLDTPALTSPFYQIPFDGEIGLENGKLNRNGYGIGFDQEEEIKLNESFAKTHDSGTSQSIGVVHARVEKEFKELNTTPLTRGRLLHLSSVTGTGAYELVFSPMMATPLLMRVSHDTTNEPFSEYYQLSQSGKAVNLGENALYWSGIPACLDFSETPSDEAFNQSPDRLATAAEKLTNWQYVYALDWDSAEREGNVYLKTILYTPTNENVSIIAETPRVRFLSSNTPNYSSFQLMDGVLSIPNNNVSAAIDSLQDVFDLVVSGDLCVYDNGIQADFYWNEDALFQGMGQTSIENEIKKLVPGQTCIAEAPPSAPA